MLTIAKLARKRRLKAQRRKVVALAHRRAMWQTNKPGEIRVAKPEPPIIKEKETDPIPEEATKIKKPKLLSRLKAMLRRLSA